MAATQTARSETLQRSRRSWGELEGRSLAHTITAQRQRVADHTMAVKPERMSGLAKPDNVRLAAVITQLAQGEKLGASNDSEGKLPPLSHSQRKLYPVQTKRAEGAENTLEQTQRCGQPASAASPRRMMPSGRISTLEKLPSVSAATVPPAQSKEAEAQQQPMPSEREHSSTSKRVKCDQLRHFGFVTLSPIAQGAFSQVVRARELGGQTRHEFAVKTWVNNKVKKDRHLALAMRAELDALHKVAEHMHPVSLK